MTKYEIRIFNNETCSDRGIGGEDTITKFEICGKNKRLKETLLKVLQIVYKTTNYNQLSEYLNLDDDISIEKLTTDDLLTLIEEQDVSYGCPIIYYIKKNNEIIYENGVEYFEEESKSEDIIKIC